MSMRGLRYDRILASTALAVILAAPISAANAQWWPPRPPAQVTHAKPKVTKPKVAKQDPAPTPAATQSATATETPAAAAAVEAPAAPVANQPAAAPVDANTPADATGTIVPAAAPAVAAEPPAPPPDPLASLDPADRPIGEKIRDLLAAKGGPADKIFATKKERTAVEAFYQSRNLAPLW